MTRDHPNAQRSSKSLPANPTNSPTHHNHNHSHHHHHHHKVVQFEPFHLLSQDDKLIKQAADLVESSSLNRHKVCVVSIISKTSLDELVQDQLVQSILNDTPEKRRHRSKQNTKNHHVPKPEETVSQTNLIRNNELIHGFENQVTCHVDSKADVIVLNLNSFVGANQLQSLYKAVEKLGKDDAEMQSLLLELWPNWNQTLLKTMLILFIVSHIVVFYNPEPSMDYNLIQTFKILETLRLKSQPRITDLLETIASKQMFPQNWIRQGRIACPRVLFVCDASQIGIPITKSDVVGIKRDLEDQIYKVLKKTNIISRFGGSNQVIHSGLLSLPDRDDFVFILMKQDLQTSCTQAKDNENLLDELSKREEFYTSLFRSLGITQDESVGNERNTGDKKEENQHSCEGENHLSQDENESSAPLPEVDGLKTPTPSKSSLTPQQIRFRKFLNRHISEIQATQIDHVSKSNQFTKQSSLLLPRYDDFFTVLLRLKNLLFPTHFSGEQLGTDASSDTPSQWRFDQPPDERRFVDIFDLVNNDELFSKKHCHKTRLAAFDYYCRDLKAQACVSPVTRAQHERILESAQKLYLNHARGSACAYNLDLLNDQCNLHWQNSNQSMQPPDESKEGRFLRGARLCKTTSSDLVTTSHNPSHSSSTHNQKSTLAIVRRANGLKMMTSCDCGRQSSFVITPADRKKKLERIDIHRVND